MTESELKLAHLELELKSAQAERMFAATEVSRIASERNEARREVRLNEQLLEEALKREAELQQRLAVAEDIQRRMQQSLPWRVTAPLRAFSLKMRSKQT